MSEKLRTTIYLHQKLRKKAGLLMESREIDDNLTAYVELLLREDWDRRVTPTMDARLTALLEKEKAQATRPPATGVPISQAIVEAVAQLHGLPAEGERKPASAKRPSPSPKHKQGGRRRSSQKGVPKEQGMS